MLLAEKTMPGEIFKEQIGRAIVMTRDVVLVVRCGAVLRNVIHKKTFCGRTRREPKRPRHVAVIVAREGHQRPAGARRRLG